MQRHFDRVRLQSQDLADLPRGQVGAVPQGNEVPRSLVEPVYRSRDREPLKRIGSKKLSPSRFLLMKSVTGHVR